jgi:hypothetical protein
MLKFAKNINMNANQAILKKAGYFLLFVLGFWVISMWYMSPALDGMVLKQGDMQQVRYMRASADTVKAITGEHPNWNDRLFSGMPSSLITGIPQGSLLLKLRPLELFSLVKAPFSFLFLSMMSMFVLLLVAGSDRVTAAAGALGYAFMTFSISSYEAGHITKVLAMAVMPGSIAGVILMSRGKYLFGGSLFALFFAMLITYFHYQIAFYMGIILAIYLMVELIRTIKNKQWMHYLKMVGVSLMASVLSLFTVIGKFQDTLQYSKATMRGGSAVASEVPQSGPKQVSAKGLDIDYAFSWSYGIDETMTLLVPRFKGGSSDELVPENDFGVDRLPTYFGDMQFTSGPVYMGASLMFLFILSIVFGIQNWREKVLNSSNAKFESDEVEKAQQFFYLTLFALLTFVVSLVLSWGKNLSINEWFFNNLPYYNKFRTPMMALVIAQTIVPFYGIYGLYILITQKFTAGFTQSLVKTTLIVAGVLVGFIFLLANSQDFAGVSDAQIVAQIGKENLPIIKNLRSDILWSDVWRSSLFIGFTALLVWMGIRKQVNAMYLSIAMIVVVGIDMIGVSNRYLSESNWESKETEEAIIPSQADEQLMAVNKKENARVFDLRYNPFNDNHAAPFHRNVGGYHPAKLSRYQDIISFGITRNGAQLNSDVIFQNNVLDMLNCKYVLSMDKAGKEEIIPRNTNYGHVWLVDSVAVADNAKSALEKINNLNLRNYAVVESSETSKPSALVYQRDSADKYVQTTYSSDTIRYEGTNKSKALLVFSEIYYNEKNGGWNVFVDSKPATALRVNYVLRAVELEPGKHQIEWRYVPADRSLLVNVELGTSIIILLGFLGMLFKELKTQAEEKEVA